MSSDFYQNRFISSTPHIICREAMGARDRGVWRFGCSETMTAPARSLQVVAERRSSPAGNSHAYHRTPPNMIETDVVPPIEDILQSLRRLNADVQICHASSKRKENRPSPWESMREFNSSDSSSSSMNGFDHLEQSMQSIGREMQSAKKQVETILSQVRELSGEFLESSSPQLHHHREHVHYHHETSKAYVLAPMFKQSKIKLREIIEPAPIVQDPVDRRDDVNEVSGQKLQGTAAHQVFEEMPQSMATFDDEDKGVKNQETEVSSNAESTDCVVEEISVPKVQGIQEFPLKATSKDFPEFTFNPPVLEFQKVHMEKDHKFEIDFIMDDAKFEMSPYVKEVQDCTLVFPAIETEELSYVVKVNCKLDSDSVALVAAYYFQVMRPNGEAKKRIGVG